MWVVKVGGSLYKSNKLPLWLSRLVLLGGQTVIVPGGGPFADQVRSAQQRWKIADTHAHAMALLAMDQFGHLLLGLEPRLWPAANRQDIEQLLHQQQVPIWLPAAELLGHPHIPETWEITSDSLAAWLSGKLQARGLILVKQKRLPKQATSAATLAKEGVVDPAFPSFLHSAGVPCCCLAIGDHTKIGQDLSPGLGTRILLP